MKFLNVATLFVLATGGSAALAELRPGPAMLIDPASQTAQPCTVVGIIGESAYVITVTDGTGAAEFVAPCKLLYNLKK